MVKYKAVIPTVLSTVVFFSGGYYLGRKIGTDIFTEVDSIVQNSKHIKIDEGEEKR